MKILKHTDIDISTKTKHKYTQSVPLKTGLLARRNQASRFKVEHSVLTALLLKVQFFWNSGVARFSDARGEHEQWPHLTEITNLRKSQLFVRFPFASII